MKPFVCDASSKGYVKNLTKNFDNLSQLKRLETSQSSYECRFVTRMKRNNSLPDVLEGTKLSIHLDTQENCYFGEENEKEGTTSKGVRKKILHAVRYFFGFLRFEIRYFSLFSLKFVIVSEYLFCRSFVTNLLLLL